jgi:hypothetical protein
MIREIPTENSITFRTANPALFGAATTKGERAFCDAATGGVESPLWVQAVLKLLGKLAQFGSRRRLRSTTSF